LFAKRRRGKALHGKRSMLGVTDGRGISSLTEKNSGTREKAIGGDRSDRGEKESSPTSGKGEGIPAAEAEWEINLSSQRNIRENSNSTRRRKERGGLHGKGHLSR